MSSDQQAPHWALFEQAMREGDGDAAERALGAAVELEPDQGTAFLRISQIAYRAGQVGISVASALKAAGVPPVDPGARLDLVMQLLQLGESEAAHGLCSSFPMDAPGELQLRAARLLTSIEDFPGAEAALARAADRGIPDAELHRFRARVHAALGRLDMAEAEFSAALAQRNTTELDPAYLSRLATWSPQRNHVDAVTAALAECAPGDPRIVGYGFALFKELHDLGEHQRAWDMLQLGCAAKRASLRYDADADEALMSSLVEAPGLRGDPMVPAADDPVPIFIVGLPRAGSTLVDRILGNHSRIESAGELKDLVVQARLACGLRGMEPLDAALLERLPRADLAEIGRQYIAHVRWRLGGRRYFIDKTPLNYLHIGLVRAALPHARIIHAFRQPMEACFSIYKFVFPVLYPFSYDQEELGRHYLQYRRVMAHWHGLYPGAILDVDHDLLLQDPEAEVQRMLDYCGLESETGLTDLRRNQAPAATGSNAQVREGVTTRYRGQWRRYAGQLQPLQRIIGDAGYIG